jgi:hypothetical protein
MEIAKLQYKDKETAIADLIAKGVYKEVENLDKEITLNYGEGIQAIVEIGLIVQVQGTYDEEGNVITEPIYYDGYFYDVMSIQHIDYGAAEIFPVNCVHSFAGYAQNADGPVDMEIQDPTTEDLSN